MGLTEKDILVEIRNVSTFSKGVIEMYEINWEGEGAFHIKFTDGSRTVECAVEGGTILGDPEVSLFSIELKNKLYELISLRNKLLILRDSSKTSQ